MMGRVAVDKIIMIFVGGRYEEVESAANEESAINNINIVSRALF
jgi:hypothetical protein